MNNSLQLSMVFGRCQNAAKNPGLVLFLFCLSNQHTIACKPSVVNGVGERGRKGRGLEINWRRSKDNLPPGPFETAALCTGVPAKDNVRYIKKLELRVEIVTWYIFNSTVQAKQYYICS